MGIMRVIGVLPNLPKFPKLSNLTINNRKASATLLLAIHNDILAVDTLDMDGFQDCG